MEKFIEINSFEIKIIIVLLLFLSTVISFLISLKKRGKVSGKYLSVYWFVTVVILVGTIFVGRPVVLGFLNQPKLLGYSPKTGLIVNPQLPDITLNFSSVINITDLKIYSHPEIDFIVRFKRVFGILPWSKNITISPKTTLPFGEKFIIYFSDINGPLNHENGEIMVDVTTGSLDVINVEPQENSEVSADQEFKIKLSDSISNISEWIVVSDPPEIFTVEIVDSNTLKFKAVGPLRQGSKYQLSVIHSPRISDRTTGREVKRVEPKTKKIINVTTAVAANVNSYEPKGDGINPNTEISVSFKEPMDKDSVEKNIIVSPIFTFDTKWNSDNTKVTLVNNPLAKGTEYAISLTKGILTAKGGLLESEFSYHFHTAGPLKLESSIPKNNAVNIVQNAIINLYFDQEITNQTMNLIIINPDTPGKITVSGNRYQFISDKPLLSDTKYSFTINAGTTGLYGLPSLQNQTISFSTLPNLTLLDVPFYHQESLFTCNISAARMLLAYRGISVTEQQLIDLIGTTGSKGTGNPYNGYVDNYGTYWDPVAKGVTNFRPTRMITSGKLSDIIIELKKGNPVMTWGQNGWSTPRDISWTLNDGTYIRAINGMHSTVVRGFAGPENNPTEIYLNDPWRGQYSISTDEFIRRWNYFLVAMVVD